MRVGPAKKRASLVPKAFGMCVEAFFCLVPPCGIVSFSSKEKEKRVYFSLAKLVAKERRFFQNDQNSFCFLKKQNVNK